MSVELRKALLTDKQYKLEYPIKKLDEDDVCLGCGGETKAEHLEPHWMLYWICDKCDRAWLSKVQ